MMSEFRERSVVTFTADQIISTTTVARSFKKTREIAQEIPLFVTNVNGEIDTVIIGFHQFEEMCEMIKKQASLIEELEILSRLRDTDTASDALIAAENVFAYLGIED